MRVLLVGSPADRARVKSQLAAADVEIVAEFATLASARDAVHDVDAIVLASRAIAPDIGDEFAEPLTSREREGLDLLAEGMSNKAIAARLEISDQTVKFHVASIYGKLGAANRTDAVRRAVRRGLVTL